MFQKRTMGTMGVAFQMYAPYLVCAVYGAEPMGKGDEAVARLAAPTACVEASSGDTITVQLPGCPGDPISLGTVTIQLPPDAVGTFDLCMHGPDPDPRADSDCGCVTIIIYPLYGDVDESGEVDFADLMCAFSCFESEGSACPEGDISPCGGDGVCDVGDLLAVLSALDDG